MGFEFVAKFMAGLFNVLAILYCALTTYVLWRIAKAP